jgi:hypothetical protein
MAELKAPSQLLAETLEVAERHAERRRELTAQGDRPPALGDVYVLEATRDYPVHWVLVTHDPADPALLLAVPADGNFLVGSADVALPEGAAVGALTVRCRFGVWIASAHLETRERVGVIEERVVSQAHEKWSDLGNRGVVGTVLEREVDDDPEYQEWVEDVLRPARETLLEKKVGASSGEKKKDSETRPPKKPYPFLLMAAASILFAVAGGYAGVQVWRQHQRILAMQSAGEIAERRHREEVERLETERARLETEYRRELARAGEAHAETARNLREQIAELDRRLEVVKQASTVVNPMIAYFEPPRFTTRGQKTIVLRPGASHVVLLFGLLEVSPAERYRLELRESGREVPVWTNDRLTLEEPGEIRVGVPAGILSVGEYDLELSGLKDGEFRSIGEYELEVTE